MKILLVEDDKEINEMLTSFLISEGFDVTGTRDGMEAWKCFQENTFDLVLLDLMLPTLSGMEVMRRIRQQSVVPILILSARDTDSDITLGLGLGADDYITKPFSVTQVTARIKANLRRMNQYSSPKEDTEPVITYGSLVLNQEDYTLSKNGEKLDLTSKEFDILKLLLLHPKKVYTKEQIYSLVWKDAYCGDENAVNVHISRLRNKIEDDPRSPRYVVTVWGIGYKLGEIL